MAGECWWERRGAGEPTANYLGRVLDDLDLPEMARRARDGHFDDYFCPPDVDDGLNIHRLVAELERHARSANRARRLCIREVIVAAKQGEFDGTKDESQRWMASKGGQDAFRDLLGGR